MTVQKLLDAFAGGGALPEWVVLVVALVWIAVQALKRAPEIIRARNDRLIIKYLISRQSKARPAQLNQASIRVGPENDGIS